MSVIMTMRIPGDPAALERYAKDHADELEAIAERGKQHGVARP